MPLDAQELGKRLKKLEKSVKGFPKNPTVEEVHDLRTRARRVESILNALGMDSGTPKKLLTDIKTIRRRAGTVRDMDVFTAHVVGLGTNGDSDCVVRLLHHLGYERYRHSKKLHSAVQQSSASLRRRLRVSRRKVEKDVGRFSKMKTDLRGKASQGQEESPLHATSVALRLLEELRAVPRLGPDNLHNFRIEVKRLRYVLEMAGEDGHQKEFIDQLKLVQDSIGEWHDWLELTGIAHDVLQHERSCQVIHKLQGTADEKFKEALKIAEQMRHRYLVPSVTTKKSKTAKRERGGGLPGPVLVAASEMLA